MALTGTLSDVAIVTLLQFPNTGKRTGCIQVRSEDKQASFYYDAGRLVHAVMGDVKGEEVLVEAVGWTEGDFTFVPSSELPELEATIEKDLHRSIMWALKERDERKDMRRTGSAAEALPGSQKLEKLVADSGSFVFVCLIRGGEVLCSSKPNNEAGEIVTELQKAVCALLACYPEKIPRRLIMDDEKCCMICEAIDETTAMMAVDEPGVKMGALLIAAARMAESLRKDN